MARGRGKYQGAHFSTPTTPSEQQVEYQEYRKPKRRRSKAPLIIILVLILLAGLGVGGYIFWQHRPVSVTVNGQSRTAFKQSTIDDVYKNEGISSTPGDYVSVSGKVLKAGKGDAYSVTVNGTQMSYDDAVSYQIVGNENIEFGDGANKSEEYTSEVVEEQPKLEYQVAPGTGEKGYAVQQGTVQYISQWGQAGKYEIRTGKETGETAKGEVESETKNCIVTAQNISPDGGEKLVALTFDDGPTYFTEPYLKILEEKKVKATFSIIGEQLADGGPVVAETSKAGHQIISHTWDHKQLTTLDQKDVQQEIGDTAKTLKEWIGKDVMYMRAPYGDMDENVWLKSGGLLSVSVYWTHDSQDWTTPGVDEIVNNCTMNMAPGSVILMHDGGGDRNQDLEALPKIIDAWKDAGYKFVTVEELLASDSSISMDAIDGGAPMPDGAVWPTELK